MSLNVGVQPYPSRKWSEDPNQPFRKGQIIGALGSYYSYGMETSSSKPIRADTIEKVRSVFKELEDSFSVNIEKKEAISNYLQLFPDLVEILKPITQQARDRLGETARLLLRMQGSLDDSHIDLVVRKRDYTNIGEELDSLSLHSESLLRNSAGWIHVTTDLMPF